MCYITVNLQYNSQTKTSQFESYSLQDLQEQIITGKPSLTTGKSSIFTGKSCIYDGRAVSNNTSLKWTILDYNTYGNCCLDLRTISLKNKSSSTYILHTKSCLMCWLNVVLTVLHYVHVALYSLSKFQCSTCKMSFYISNFTRRKVWTHKTSFTQSHFIDVPVPSQDSERTYVSLGIYFASFYTFPINIFNSVVFPCLSIYETILAWQLLTFVYYRTVYLWWLVVSFLEIWLIQ